MEYTQKLYSEIEKINHLFLIFPDLEVVRNSDDCLFYTNCHNEEYLITKITENCGAIYGAINLQCYYNIPFNGQNYIIFSKKVAEFGKTIAESNYYSFKIKLVDWFLDLGFLPEKNLNEIYQAQAKFIQKYPNYKLVKDGIPDKIKQLIGFI